MTPVRFTGDRCERCPEGRAALRDGLCGPCWMLLKSFGHDPAAPRSVWSCADPAFDLELRRWLGEA